MSNFYLTTGAPERALEASHRALAIANSLEDFSLQVMTNLFRGRAYKALGNYHRAIDCLKQNVVSLEGKGVSEPFGLIGPASGQSRTALVMCLAELGEFTEGSLLGKEAIQIAESVDNAFNRADAYKWLGFLYICKGDLQQARPVLEQSLALCQVWNMPMEFLNVSALLGFAYALSGRLPEALPLLEQAVEQAAAMGRMREHSLKIAGLSEAYLWAGRIDNAAQLAEQALELATTHKERGNQAHALRLLGAVYAHRDPLEAEHAETSYRQALALATELGMRPLQAHCHRGLGTLYSKVERWEHARTTLATAIDLYRSMEMTFWLPQTEEALAQVEGR